MRYHNKGALTEKLVAALCVLLALLALGSLIYVRVLYATGDISFEDYARMTGQTPNVVLVR